MNGVPAIVVRNVTKTFVMHPGRELIRNRLTALFRRRQTHKFYALRDVSFEVGKGESVGLVGLNGAGKSTLLSVVAGLAVPESGSIGVDGRVGPLLQLGAGFHMDLSGLENIRLNASLMGLRRRETESLLDSIIDFAELGEFINEPVRTYSTGMVMRLAFSVAIHMDPEILIVDEVLGVGDAAFQAKCFDRFLRFRAAGHTILAVSHSTEMLLKLCSRGIWLEHGRIRMDGPIGEVVKAYAEHLHL